MDFEDFPEFLIILYIVYNYDVMPDDACLCLPKSDDASLQPAETMSKNQGKSPLRFGVTIERQDRLRTLTKHTC